MPRQGSINFQCRPFSSFAGSGGHVIDKSLAFKAVVTIILPPPSLFLAGSPRAMIRNPLSSISTTELQTDKDLPAMQV